MGAHVVALFISEQKRSQALADGLAALGIQVIQTQSSEQLCSLVNNNRIDAVVVEQHLGGFLTGLEILERLRAQLLRPILVIFGELGEKEKSVAADLRIDFVCSWEIGLERICTSISGLLGLARQETFLIPAAARQLVVDSGHIGVMPQLAGRLIRYLNDENTTIHELAQDISSDARVTAELIKLINSSAFGLKSTITHVESAVRYLGIRPTVSLVLEMSFHSIRNSWYQRLPSEVLHWFGLRSVVNACVASAFANHCRDVSPETVYVLALLQDIGILLLCHKYQGRYVSLLSRSRAVAQLQLERLEKSEYSFTHAEVSAALLQHWEFPASIIHLVLEHHSPSDNLSDLERKLLNLMQLGEAVANLREAASPQRYSRFQKLLAETVRLSPLEAKACISTAIGRSREVTSYFDLAIPDEDTWWNLASQMQDFLDSGRNREFLAQSESPSEGLPRVMVLDDSLAVAELIYTCLSEYPLTVKHFPKLPTPSEVPKDVAAIFCDVLVQGQGTIEFVRELRALGFARPIIIITADRSRNTVMQAISAGISSFIPKPLTKAYLLDKLKRHRLIDQIVAAAPVA